MHPFTKRPLAAAIVAAVSAGAFAQTPPERTLREVEVRATGETATGPVDGYRATRSSTFTKTDTPLKDVPASITVVPADLMKDQAMQGMGDVFRYVPGALMHQGEGNRDQVVLRGTSTTADFFVDGVRDDAQVFRDLYNLERVEVLKGPGGMIFGRGGAGGVVNRVAKVPAFERILDASLTVGSQQQVRATFDIGNAFGDSAAFRLNGMLEDGNSFRQGAGLHRYALNPTLLVKVAPRTTLLAGVEHLRDERTADRGFPSQNGAPFNAEPGRFFGNAQQSTARSNVDGAYAVVTHDFGGGVQLKNTTRTTHYDKFYQNVYPGSAVSTGGTMTLSAYNNANQRTNTFNQTDLTFGLRTGAIEHRLLAGMELGRQDSTNLRNTGFFGATTSITVAAANPFAFATRFAQNGTDANNKVKANVAAFYLQDQVTVAEGWKVLLGLRHDRFRVEFDDRRTLVTPTDLSRTDTGWSPRAGLIWQPTSRQTYYASSSYAMLPSGEQLGLAPTNASLAPETSRNAEIGARWDLLPKLTLSAAVYRTQRDNVHVNDPANPGNFVQTGQQRVDGAEVGLSGEVTKDWSVYAGASAMDGRITRAISSGTTASAASVVPVGNRIGLVPGSTASLWNRVRLGAGWAAGLGVVHQSASFTSFTNAVTLPAFTRADGAVYYAFADGRTRLALNVENLFDRRYFPTVDGDNNISPGAPRAVRLTVSASF